MHDLAYWAARVEGVDFKVGPEEAYAFHLQNKKIQASFMCHVPS